jgi:hypothetical protein
MCVIRAAWPTHIVVSHGAGLMAGYGVSVIAAPRRAAMLAPPAPFPRYWTGAAMKERPMLEYALHPVEDRLIHVDDLAPTGAVPRPWARCPLCHGPLHVVALRDRARSRRFLHLARGLAACPLVRDALPNPLAMRIGPPLDAQGRQRRAHFLQHWQRHLHTIRQVASSFGIARFMRTIEHADVLKLWAWPTLAQRDIPYILLVLTEFIAASSGGRTTFWSRFWFDGSVRDIGDFDQARERLPHLFRLRYRPPRRAAFPGVRHLIGCEPVAMEEANAPAAQDGMPRQDVAAFEAFIARALGRAAD